MQLREEEQAVCRELVSQLGGRTENHRDGESTILSKGQALSDPTEARNETRLPSAPTSFQYCAGSSSKAREEN